MKATGIVRRIDDLGRIVVPKEIRRTLRIREGDPLEIFTDREGEIILKKYSPIGELGEFAKEYADSLYEATGHIAAISDRDQIIAVAGAADDGAAALGRHTGVGGDDMLHHSLGDAHCVDGISGFVGRQADDALNASLDGGMQHIVGALNVGAHGFHREELAGRDLLQRSSVENEVDAGHDIAERPRVAHIADVELDLFGIGRVLGLQLVAHIVLLFLIAGENADLADISRQKMLEHGVAKAAGAAGDQQGFIFENGICHGFLLSGDELLVVGAAASGIFQCP